ncbi:MAG: transcription antiterminator BglG [Thermoprotei archaeon]
MQYLLITLLKYRRVLYSELSNLTGIPEDLIKEKLKEVREYVELSDYEVVVKKPLELAYLLLAKGVPVKEVSKYLDWKDFERVSAEILSKHNYVVITNFSLTKPVKLEIDVIGVDIGSGRGLFIDCKHWSRGVSRKSLINIIEKHNARIEKFIKYYSWAKPKWYYFKYLRTIIPLIITLTTPSLRFYKNTLVVSIQELNQVLLDLPVILDTFNIEPIKIKNL